MDVPSDRMQPDGTAIFQWDSALTQGPPLAETTKDNSRRSLTVVWRHQLHLSELQQLCCTSVHHWRVVERCWTRRFRLSDRACSPGAISLKGSRSESSGVDNNALAITDLGRRHGCLTDFWSRKKHKKKPLDYKSGRRMQIFVLWLAKLQQSVWGHFWIGKWTVVRSCAGLILKLANVEGALEIHLSNRSALPRKFGLVKHRAFVAVRPSLSIFDVFWRGSLWFPHQSCCCLCKISI